MDASYWWARISPMWAEALRVSGPEMPKWVKSISPRSRKISLPSSRRLNSTFRRDKPIICRQRSPVSTRLTRLGTGSTMVWPAWAASL